MKILDTPLLSSDVPFSVDHQWNFFLMKKRNVSSIQIDFFVKDTKALTEIRSRKASHRAYFTFADLV